MLVHVKEILLVALMVFGFGFVVFFHELGHFLAAKWVGIRVEQFAVGFGQALFAWRKGLGWRIGTTTKEVRRRAEEYLDKKGKADPALKDESGYSDEQINMAADELGLGETEYRLNWIPLGGYVKMLGQDDLKPNATASDPRAYNRKSIGQRMVVVSAGVIMNIILAAIGFMVVFLIGFSSPPPVVGTLVSGSPAQKAGVHVGDRVLSLDGSPQYDFTKISLNTALLQEGEDVPIVVQRLGEDNKPVTLTLHIRPARQENDKKGFLMLGIGPSRELRGLDLEAKTEFETMKDPKHYLPDYTVIAPGETIIAIGGKPLTDASGQPLTAASDAKKLAEAARDYYKLDDALQASDGKPVAVTVRTAAGATREAAIKPRLDHTFGPDLLTIAGMMPRPTVDEIPEDSAVVNKLEPGDIITEIRKEDDHNDLKAFPSEQDVRETSYGAGDKGVKLTFTVIRNGKQLPPITGLEPKIRVGNGKRGLGIRIGMDSTPVVSQVADNSAAKRAGIPMGTRLISVDGKPVENWMQVARLLSTAGKHTISGVAPGETEPQNYAMELAAADADALKQVRVFSYAILHERQEERKTSSPVTAASWGVTETRDFVLQFYVTIRRMFQGSVSYTNMMGPVGIVTAGAKFAFKGMDWLIWFLAMISANLAVVNFLPIPIVDGGLFTFLILEKIQGKPLSPRAQAVAQIVGFAVIISVFLLVTFQDIKRMWM